MRTLPRHRLDEQLALAAEVRLLMVTAPPGWGKTTALAGLAARGGWPVAWLRLLAAPSPEQLLTELVAACRPLLPRLPEATSPEAFASALADQLDDDLILVLDDADPLAAPDLAALLARLQAALPARAHLVLLTRQPLSFPWLLPSIARGEAARLDASTLAFTVEEAAALFAHHRRPLDPAAAVASCAGWPLALDLLARHGSWDTIHPLLTAFWEQEVLAQLDAPTREAVLAAAALDDLSPAALTALGEVLGRPLSLAWLAEQGVLSQGTQLVPVLRDLLRTLAQRDRAHWQALHQQLAEHPALPPWQATTHLLHANQPAAARQRLLAQAPAWLDQAPATVRQLVAALYPEGAPPLAQVWSAAASHYLGDLGTALAGYQAALAAARAQGERAAEGEALRGLAALGLDTAQPYLALPALKQLLRALPPTASAERAEILAQQAECWLNRGWVRVARRLLAAAHALGGQRVTRPDLEARLLLRSGELAAAASHLEAASGVGTLGGVIAAHREPALVLAYLDAVRGESARALALARRGVLEAEQAGQPLSEAIALIRLGHALQLASPLDPPLAERAYRQALARCQTLALDRPVAEAALGLVLARGQAGDWAGAEEAFQQGMTIAGRVGDEWIAAWLTLALASVQIAQEDPASTDLLTQAARRFARLDDRFGQLLVQLWGAIAAHRFGADPALQVQQLFARASEAELTPLFCRPTLFGPRDPMALVPVLLTARQQPEIAARAGRLLRAAFPTLATDPTVTTYHPGYTLRVQLLGSFRVWRGQREVSATEWQREKARQLFQLLLTFRGRWLQREQICALLWPETQPAAAEVQFKVALNALNAAIEPRRPARAAPFFIRRQGLAYAFAPSAGVWIDVDEFDLRIATATRDPAFALRGRQIAVQLYSDDYLAESLYDSWTIEERERLLTRFLRTATELGELLLEQGEVEEAIALAERVLKRERAAEMAYQLLLRAYGQLGDRGAALRTYRRCQRALREELGAEPLPQTTALFERIRRGLPGKAY